MIKLILNSSLLHVFYIKEIVPRLIERIFSQKCSYLNQILILSKSVCGYKYTCKREEFIADLLLLSPDNLIKKYKIIEDYCRLVLFCFYYKTKKHRKKFCSYNKKLLNFSRYNKNYNKKLLEFILKKLRQEISSDFFYTIVLKKIKGQDNQESQDNLKDLEDQFKLYLYNN